MIPLMLKLKQPNLSPLRLSVPPCNITTSGLKLAIILSMTGLKICYMESSFKPSFKGKLTA